MSTAPAAFPSAFRHTRPIPPGMRQVLVRDCVLYCSIGVHAHEEQAKQRVRLNLVLDVAESAKPIDDKLVNVVCYDEIISGVKRMVDAGHVRLIETLAESVAELCLADDRVRHVRVEIEKLDVYQDVGSVGVAIERSNSAPYSP